MRPPKKSGAPACAVRCCRRRPRSALALPSARDDGAAAAAHSARALPRAPARGRATRWQRHRARRPPPRSAHRSHPRPLVACAAQGEAAPRSRPSRDVRGASRRGAGCRMGGHQCRRRAARLPTAAAPRMRGAIARRPERRVRPLRIQTCRECRQARLPSRDRLLRPRRRSRQHPRAAWPTASHRACSCAAAHTRSASPLPARATARCRQRHSTSGRRAAPSSHWWVPPSTAERTRRAESPPLRRTRQRSSRRAAMPPSAAAAAACSGRRYFRYGTCPSRRDTLSAAAPRHPSCLDRSCLPWHVLHP